MRWAAIEALAVSQPQEVRELLDRAPTFQDPARRRRVVALLEKKQEEPQPGSDLKAPGDSDAAASEAVSEEADAEPAVVDEAAGAATEKEARSASQAGAKKQRRGKRRSQPA